MLNVTRLRMLREVAARGTIAAAAEALFMTPSAVSQQMSVWSERPARRCWSGAAEASGSPTPD